MRRATARRTGAGPAAAAVVAAVLVLGGCGKTITIEDAEPSPSSADGGADPGTGSDGAADTSALIEVVDGPAPDGALAPTPDGGGGATGIGAEQRPQETVGLSVDENALGTVVVDGAGASLYRFDEDSDDPSRSTCVEECATTWPPLLVEDGATVYADGVDADEVTTVERPDGGVQVAVGGWPVYAFAGDHSPGDTEGQGVKGTWFAVSPTGGRVGAEDAQDAEDAGSGGDRGPGVEGSLLTLQDSRVGSVVADEQGLTVYASGADAADPPTVGCTGGCAAGHEPVTVTGATDVGIPGISQEKVGSVRRPDGTRQVTLYGVPLYTDDRDEEPGDVTASPGWFALVLDGQRR